MKKAKIILAAIAVIAIGGSALALKSQKKVDALVYLAAGANQPAYYTYTGTITAAEFEGATLTYASTATTANVGDNPTWVVARD